MKYTPKYKIKSVKFTHKGKQYDVKSSDILSGVYEYEKGGKLKDYTYISKNDVKEFITNDGSIEKHSNGIWVLSKVLKETPKKAIKKSTPKKEIKKTTTNKKSVSKAKIGTLLTPSEKFKGKKNMPVKAFEDAENMVEMKKAKVKKSEIMKLQDSLFKILQSEKYSEDSHEPLAYTVLWLNFNMPMSYGFAILNEQDIYGLGLIEAYKKEFKNFPDVSKKVIKIKTGNFTSNLIEQKLSKDFAGNDDLRPNMKFTYIDDGYAVSTDAHKLLAIYDKSLLGKEEFFGGKDELWKLGKMAKYPKWRQVIPNKYVLKTKKINAQLLYNFLLKAIKYKATSGYSYGIIIKINEETSIGFNARLLIESLGTSMKFGDNVYLHYIEDAKQKAVVFSNIEDWDLGKPDSTFVLLMPIMVYDNSNEAHLIYDLNTESYEKGGGVDKYKIGTKYEKYIVGSPKWNQLNKKAKSKPKSKSQRITDKLAQKEFGKNYSDLNDSEKYFIDDAFISSQSMAKGGEVKQTIDALKKGDEITIKFGSSVSKDNSVNLKVRSRNKVRKGTIDKITFENIKNPKGVKFYAYERGGGRWFFAMGDMAISNIEIVSNVSMAKGGVIYKHKFIPTMTFEITGETAKGYKGIQKDKKSLSRLERTKGKKVSYSSSELKELFTNEKKLAKGGTIIKKGNRVRVVNTQYDGKEGLVVSNDLQNGNYQVQIDGKVKGFPFENLMLLSRETYAKGGKTKTKKPNSFFAVVKREQKEGESWKDAIQRVKKEKSKKK